jgi:hyperosmotically inducible periplasmic protein
MRKKSGLTQACVVFLLALMAGAPFAAGAQNPQLQSPQARSGHALELMKDEVRHQLVMLPYHSVFDWIEAEVQPDGVVILNGDVREPKLKKDAESSLTKVEGVTRVSNNLNVLPLSNHDDDLRVMIYRSIYRSDSPLFKYALQSVGPIHIIVNNGHVTLKGVVDSDSDAQIAYIRAREVPGSFEVKNELQVVKSEKPTS